MAAGATVFIPDINCQKPSKSKFQDIVQCIRKNNIENIILPPVINKEWDISHSIILKL